MSNLAIPFNIELLHLTPQLLSGIKAVSSLDVFEGSSKNFNEDGLFSTSIFGRMGDPLRNKRLSYIDIKVSIFHPIVYNALIEIKSLYGEILSGKSYAVFDPAIKDFIKSDLTQGETGYAFFVSHFKDLVFAQTGSDARISNIRIIEKYKSAALTSQVVVMPAGLRDYEIDDDGKQSEDEFNTLYRKLLILSSTIHKSLITEESISGYDSLRYSLQIAFNNLYDKLKSMLEGKHKLILGKWASRGIFNGTRNVISTTNIKTEELLSRGSISTNDTVMGLYQYLKATLPVSKYQIKTGFLSKVFIASNSATLVNKKTLESEVVRIDASSYDEWMSDEGLDSTITLYSEEANRAKALEVSGHYLGLIYKGVDKEGNDSFKLFQDIHELPKDFDPAFVSPITFTELLYLSIYKYYRGYPVFVTRYPITGFGSIYPSWIYLKPTVDTEVRYELGDDWNPTGEIAYTFPVGTTYVNSLSPSPSKLAGLGADFDGDTCSANVVYTQEAIDEVKALLNSRNYYVNTSGKIAFSMATDTVNYLMAGLTSEAVLE